MKNEEKKSFKCGCVYPCEDYPHCGGTKITLGEPEKEEITSKEKLGWSNTYTPPEHNIIATSFSNLSKVEERVEEKGTEQVGYVNQLFDTLKKYYSDQDRTLAQMLKTIADLEASHDQFAMRFLEWVNRYDFKKQSWTSEELLKEFKQSLTK
jgi:hypothetical protein